MTESKLLIFGTANQAKIQMVQGALEGTGIIVKSIKEFNTDLPEVEEDGKDAVENARKKSVTYAQLIQKPVFSMDNALYFKGLSDDEQPGIYVRRINKKEASSEEEVLRYYKEFVDAHGGQLEGWWEFGVSIARPDGSSAETIITSPRLFVSTASEVSIPGYPLEAMQRDPQTGKYYSEFTDDEQAEHWQKNIGKALEAFVSANL